MIIVFLESVLNMTPILFVQFGQVIGGAIDYNMQATTYNSARIDGNINYYNMNMFDSPFDPPPQPDEPDDPVDPDNPDNDDEYLFLRREGDDNCNPCTQDCYNQTACDEWKAQYVKPYDDHIWVNVTNSTYALARTSYYQDRLSDLDDFWGFFPRTFLPQTKLYANGNTAKVTLFFIDSHKEIKTGVGLDFPVCKLNENEM